MSDNEQALDLAYIRKKVNAPAALTYEQGKALLSEVDRLRAERDGLSAKIEQARKALDDSMPPYNMELRPDGSEEPISAAYVEGYGEAYRPTYAILSAAPSDVLAEVKREAAAQALQDAADHADEIHRGMHVGTITDRLTTWLTARAAAIREGRS